MPANLAWVLWQDGVDIAARMPCFPAFPKGPVLQSAPRVLYAGHRHERAQVDAVVVVDGNAGVLFSVLFCSWACMPRSGRVVLPDSSPSTACECLARCNKYSLFMVKRFH